MNATASVGTVFDDLGDVAGRIKSHALSSIQIVWLNNQGSVHTSDFGLSQGLDIAAEDYVGTYTMLASEQDIEDDLRVTLRARAGHWLLTGLE